MSTSQEEDTPTKSTLRKVAGACLFMCVTCPDPHLESSPLHFSSNMSNANTIVGHFLVGPLRKLGSSLSVFDGLCERMVHRGLRRLQAPSMLHSQCALFW